MSPIEESNNETKVRDEANNLADQLRDLIEGYEVKTGQMLSEMEMVRGPSESIDHHPPLHKINLIIRI